MCAMTRLFVVLALSAAAAEASGLARAVDEVCEDIDLVRDAVRGRGLLACVELVEPDGSGRPMDPARASELDRKAWERGALVYARGSGLRLAPPLCISPAEVDQLVAVVAESIQALGRDLGM